MSLKGNVLFSGLGPFNSKLCQHKVRRNGFIYIYIYTHTHTHTCIHMYVYIYGASPVTAIPVNSSCNSGDAGSIPGSGRSPGGGHGNLLHYSCLENSMDL